ncbi:GNAT family N-acetyltransferase [Spirosoma pollinicola]|uniref:RimJ/RimL family protein N-acetyltransferase n=1 Tax=Spirosoma pollinicola TaxID=2057025 RepID=A0A2K8YWP2_9BACT|nr:GNAT family N-acetyltransferase [Spirosoma pollinicola]AUD02019.1 RimJ/RimL family protein N-acetyltransferase [Spirosoma pollinicola]
MIETDRLLLIELTVDDAAFMLDLLNTPSWIQFIGDRHVQTLWDAQQYIINGALKSYKEHGFGPYLVKLKTNGLSIGLCGLFKRDALDDPDIGFAFLPDYAGKGYGYEAGSAVITYAQKTFGLTRIFGFTNPANQPSIRLLEKLGLRLEKRFTFTGNGEESLLFGRLLVNL